MEKGELQRGSGCDMKYSDGGGKIQLTPFFLWTGASFLQHMAGKEKRVDVGDTRGKGEEKQKQWHKIRQGGNRGEEVWTEEKKERRNI